MHYSLYILKHPETLETIYVGMTADIVARSRGNKSKFRLKYGFTPIVDELMTFTKEHLAMEMEKLLIDNLREFGAALYNSEKYKTGGRIPGFEARIRFFQETINE